MPKVGARVECYVGDKKGLHHIGDGTFLGYVKVWMFVYPGGKIRTLENPEETPDPRWLSQLADLGVKITNEDNPKIEMDDGTIRYGCQVWWREIPVNPLRQIVVPRDYPY